MTDSERAEIAGSDIPPAISVPIVVIKKFVEDDVGNPRVVTQTGGVPTHERDTSAPVRVLDF